MCRKEKSQQPTKSIYFRRKEEGNRHVDFSKEWLYLSESGRSLGWVVRKTEGKKGTVGK